MPKIWQRGMKLSSTGNKAIVHSGVHATVCAVIYRYTFSNTCTPKQLYVEQLPQDSVLQTVSLP